MSIVDKLLQMDVRSFEMPTNEIEIDRLSKLVGEKFIVKIKAIDGQTISDIQKLAFNFKKGQVNDIDMQIMKMEMLKTGIIEPKLNSSELMDYFGVKTVDDLIDKLFLPGEQDRIFNAINELNGYDSDTEEEVKN